MWQKIIESATQVNQITGKIITEFPENPDDQYEILSVQNDTVIAYHCNGKNVLVAFGYRDLFSDKWWMKT